mmetsp:Transcript_22058/g.58098  ORF Transcript_22058/g.58098 Transcript_22058/m.58098 type:complete len:350 (-) Transcript_22058:215-1264(-)
MASSDSCAHGIGAAMEWPSFWQLMMEPHPHAYNYLIPMASAGFALTAAALVPMLVRLVLARRADKEPPAAMKKRFVYLFVPASAPLVIAALKFVVVMAPRVWKIFGILSACVEAAAFFCFLQLILDFIGGGGGDLAAALPRLTPSKLWCCCSSARVPTLRDVLAARVLVGQFMVVVIALSIVELNDDWAKAHNSFIAIVDTVSLVLCVVAELTLIRAGHDVLSQHNIHAKFWTMKGLFVANTFTRRFFSRFITESQHIGGLCYTGETLVSGFSAASTALIAVPVALLAACAFGPQDLLFPTEAVANCPATDAAESSAGSSAVAECEGEGEGEGDDVDVEVGGRQEPSRE